MEKDFKQHEPCPGTYDKRHDFKLYEETPLFKEAPQIPSTYVCLYCEQVRRIYAEGGELKVEVVKPSQKL